MEKTPSYPSVRGKLDTETSLEEESIFFINGIYRGKNASRRT